MCKTQSFPLRFLPGAVLAAVLLGPAVLAGPPAPAVRPATEGNRAPLQLRFSPDGKRLFVLESAEGTVAVLDPALPRVVARWKTGGERPTGMNVSADGRLLAVANSGSDTAVLLETGSGAVLKSFPLRGSPADAVLTTDSSVLCVSLTQKDEVALVEVSSGKIQAVVPVGFHPRALALSPSGQLACANTTSGDVSLIDVRAGREFRRARTPAVNLRGLAYGPNGRLLYVAGQRAQNERPTESAQGIWSNQVFAISPNGRVVDNIWLDIFAPDAADPDGLALSADGTRAYVACAGGNTVQSLQLGGEGYDPKIAASVGAVPRALALSPDGKQLWAANSLGNDLAVLDAATMQPLRRVGLGPASKVDPHLQGEYLFRTAVIAKGGQFSCNSCHTEGGADGISWKFVHVPDGLAKELRNVRDLRGPLRETAPFRWTGHTADLRDFVREEVHGLFEGPNLSAEQVEALCGYISSLAPPPNPNRAEDGSFTATARRGQQLFDGKAGCAVCHAGPYRGGTRRAWIGTTPEGLDLDVPHLVGVYDSAPYLHDGRAATLEEIFAKHDTSRRHGNVGALTAAEQADLFGYLREL